MHGIPTVSIFCNNDVCVTAIFPCSLGLPVDLILNSLPNRFTSYQSIDITYLPPNTSHYMLISYPTPYLTSYLTLRDPTEVGVRVLCVCAVSVCACVYIYVCM